MEEHRKIYKLFDSIIVVMEESRLASIRVAKLAPPEFLDELLDELGNPHNVKLDIYSEKELSQLMNSILSGFDIQVVNERFRGIYGFEFFARHSDANYTPKKLKQIYRQEFERRQNERETTSTNKNPKSYVAIRELHWVSPKPTDLHPTYSITFDGTSIEGGVSVKRNNLQEKIISLASQYGVEHKIELQP